MFIYILKYGQWLPNIKILTHEKFFCHGHVPIDYSKFNVRVDTKKFGQQSQSHIK